MKKSDEEFDSTHNTIFSITLFISIFILIVAIFTALSLTKNITTSLDSVKEGLLSFFSFLIVLLFVLFCFI